MLRRHPIPVGAKWEVGFMTQTRQTPKAAPPSGWRRSLRLLVWPVGCYLATLACLMIFEDRLIFFPCPAATNWRPPPADVPVQDVWFDTAHGRVHGWWLPRPGIAGALLYCHGNAGNLSQRGLLALALQQTLNESVLIVDYPGYGKSEGAPSEAGCYAAGDAAYLWLTETQKIPPERVILFGKSLGGGVATELASRRPHRALVLVKTFTSIPDLAQHLYPFFPARWLARNRFESLSRIARCSGPVLIAHGDRDGSIPYAQGRRLYDAAPEPKRFLVLPDCDHNDALPPVFYAELAGFLQQP